MNVLEAIKTRRSVRQYAETPIPDDVMQRMRQALRFAPSACNYQPWHFVIVEHEPLRRDLARAANDQLFIADAPVVIVACGLPAQAAQIGGHGSTVDIDVAIALDHLTLAAVEEGLGTCWIGSFNEAKVKALLDIPEDVRVVTLTPLGYPDSPELIHPLDDFLRKREAEIFSVDRFGSSAR